MHVMMTRMCWIIFTAAVKNVAALETAFQKMCFAESLSRAELDAAGVASVSMHRMSNGKECVLKGGGGAGS